MRFSNQSSREKDQDSPARLQDELARAPLQLQQALNQLAEPATNRHQEAQRLQLFEPALALVDKRRLPRLCAALQCDLATSLFRTPTGDRAANMERAVAAYAKALEIYTPEDFPAEWASTQNMLGIAYAERIDGDPSEKVERAIAALLGALDVHTQDKFPVEWAGIQNNLGLAYARRIRGERAENLERAIAGQQGCRLLRRSGVWLDPTVRWNSSDLKKPQYSETPVVAPADGPEQPMLRGAWQQQ